MDEMKTWDFPASAEERRRGRAREADLHVSLTDDERYAKHHEALKRLAALLVESADDVIDRMHRQAVRDGHDSPDEVKAVYEDEREYHLEKVVKVLVAEALEARRR